MSVVEETPLWPNALDAEEALLGSILIDPEALLIARPLKPSDFFREAHATIFATMRQLEEDGLAVDIVTVTTRLERTGQLEQVGGASYVHNLVNAVPTSQNARYYTRLIQKAAEGRQVLGLAQDLAGIGYYSTDPAKAALRAVETLAAKTDENGLDLTPEEARERLAALVPSLQRITDLMDEEFPPTLWVVPDLVAEGLTLLAAKPKLGKSWLALGLALAVASGGVALGTTPVEQGDVLYLALEDSPKRLRLRASQLLKGQAAPERLEYATSWPRLDEGGLRLLEVWLQAHPDARLLILDTLAKIRGHTRGATLYGDDYASLEPVQQLAHDYGVGVLVIHHTGKESREDPLDEVNATQGLNGVADNILVLRRERGKSQATLIGDGRELNGIELSLAFDATSGTWTQVETPPEDQPKTPERAEILDLLKASAGPMSPKQIAEALGKNGATIRNLLAKMVQAGEVKMKAFGKYIPIDDIDSVDSSPLEEGKKQNLPFFDEYEQPTEPKASTLSTLSMVEGENKIETAEEADEAASPLAFFDRWRKDYQPEAAPDDANLDETEARAILTPDAGQPHLLVPAGTTPTLRPASLAKAPWDSLWPISGDCTGVFCEGECVCGEHLCQDCACEAGAVVGEHPWFYDRRQPKKGTRCRFCSRPATVATRWKTPMCERCWMIASQGQGIDPRRYQPRPFGPIPGDDELEEDDPAAMEGC